jgi:hypothetical protein
MIDTRVWRYRAGEARIFPSADAVPVGEGWVDSPAKVNSQPMPREDDGNAVPVGEGWVDSPAKVNSQPMPRDVDKVVVPPRNRKERRQQK